MSRPSVDVVVPFAGSAQELAQLVDRLEGLLLGGHDSITVVDDRAGAAATEVSAENPGATPTRVGVVRTPQRRGSYHARNRGARAGAADWVLFLDADVEAPADLIDRFFDPAPGDAVGVLAGAIADERPTNGAPVSLRYAWLTGSMGHGSTLRHGRWAFAQTANCAVRRSALTAAGGFVEGIRSGGDADLCYRLVGSGWTMELRIGAAVVHRNRRRLRDMLRQLARHGSGAAWLSHRHPGSMPRRRWAGLVLWSARRVLGGLRAVAEGRHDDALVALLDPPAVWAFELGRLIPNRVRPRR